MPPPSGFIRCFGLFWSVDEVNWFPRDPDADGPFELLGRIGTKRPGLRLCDFRPQRGIYVLYDHYGPYYVGLTHRQPLGKRLKDHLLDRHEGMWDRFSWFGFRGVLQRCFTDGTRDLGKLPDKLLTESKYTIRDIEALLIQALGSHHRGNHHREHFAAAEHWTQVMKHEVDFYLDRLKPRQ